MVVVVCCIGEGGGLVVNFVFGGNVVLAVVRNVSYKVFSLSSLGKAKEEVSEHRVAFGNGEVGGNGVKVGNALQKYAHLRLLEVLLITRKLC